MAPVVETTQLAARVPVDLVERLAKIAEADDRTVSYIVRRALAEYVEKAEQQDGAAA